MIIYLVEWSQHTNIRPYMARIVDSIFTMKVDAEHRREQLEEVFGKTNFVIRAMGVDGYEHHEVL